MAFMSVLAMSVGFMFLAVAIMMAVAILVLVVLICWILGIVFAVKKKKTLRTIFFTIAGVGTAIGIIIGAWIYHLVAHQTIETKNGEVTVSTITIWQFSEAIEEDDVEKVKELLQEEPALEDYLFEPHETYYGFAIASDAYEVVKFALENGHDVDDLYTYDTEKYDTEKYGSEEDNAVSFYCSERNIFDDIDEMTVVGGDPNIFQPRMIHLLLLYKSDLSKDDERFPLLQNYLMLCCSDADFSEEEFQVLQELREAGMDMEEEFHDRSDALTYFKKMAKKVKIKKTQPEMYDRICQMLEEYN